jgi:hypothetical protein
LKIENVVRAIKQRYLLSKQTAESLAPINFIITGGAQNPTDDGPHYHSAKVALCRIQGDQSLEVLASQEYTPPPDIQHPNTNVIFKSAHRHQDRLWITTETEIVEYQLPQLQQVKTHSHPSFNDLHHVIKHKDKLFVVNTGLNCVTEYDPNNQAVIHHKVDSHSVLDVQQDTDYRQRVSTKPHLCHPNFCFVIDQQIWVTRCDLMDAICLDDHSKRIDIGSGLVHDGVVFNKYVYFSTVDGLIKIFNIESFCLIACIDMSLYVPDLNGWCRGIMPLSYNRLLVGISQFRPSKRPLKSKGSAARILCIDIHSQKLIWQSSTQELGIDTIFSLLPGDML